MTSRDKTELDMLEGAHEAKRKAGKFKPESPVRVRSTSGTEMAGLGLKAQIRKSSEEYRRGKKRDAAAFLPELRHKPARSNTKRKTRT